MLVIAIQPGFYAGSRKRVGAEFAFALKDGEKLPKWVVPANDVSRAKALNEAASKQKQDFDAMMAAAGPKRDGQPGVKMINTGFADAVGITEPAKVVTPSWYPPSPVEVAVGQSFGLEVVQGKSDSDLA